MDIKRKPKTLPIARLLTDIEKDKVCLPDFQREFVWSEKQCAKLIESVVAHYPIGTLMFLNADVNKKFGTRSFKGPDRKIKSPLYFAIDGQQRISTFYKFLRKPKQFEPLEPVEFGGKKIKMFLKLGKHVGYDINKLGKIIPLKMENEDTTNYKTQGKRRIMPLEFVRDETYSKEWVRQALGHIRNRELINGFKNQIKSVRKALSEYTCFVEIVESKLHPIDHYNIFQLLNSAGTDLTLFDEFVAKLNPLGINLRLMWKESQQSHPEMHTYDLDPVYILKMISLIRGVKSQERGNETRQSCAKKDLLKLFKTFEDLPRGDVEFRNDWNESCRYLEKTVKSIRAEYGVYSKKYLPYYPMIVTQAATEWWFDRYKSYNQRYKPKMKYKLKKWYWGSIINGEYNSQTDNRISTHFFGLRKWLRPDAKKTPKEVSFNITRQQIRKAFDRIESSADARYKALICLPLIEMHARDILSSDFLITDILHDHHIFPKKYLEDDLGIHDKDLINNIANRMLITSATNLEIKKKSPSEYLKGVHASTLRKFYLTKSIVDDGVDYQAFLHDRGEKICSYMFKYLNE
jgi:hypothetical protein